MQRIKRPEPGILVRLDARSHCRCSRCLAGSKGEHAFSEVAAVTVTRTGGLGSEGCGGSQFYLTGFYCFQYGRDCISLDPNAELNPVVKGAL